jgi:hypothetical protein
VLSLPGEELVVEKAEQSILVEWMPSTPSILRFAPQSAWEWAEMIAAVRSALQRVEAVDGPVHLIIDLTDYNRLPGGDSFAHFRLVWEMTMRTSDCGHLFIVNVSYIGRTLANAFMRVYAGRDAQRVHFPATMQDALALAAEIDASPAC